MKKEENKKNYIAGVVIISIILMIFYIISIQTTEKNIKEKINSFNFPKSSFLHGIKVETKDVSCLPFIVGNQICKLKDVKIYAKDKEEKILFLKLKEVHVEKPTFKQDDFYIVANQIQLSNKFKENIFLNYENPDLKQIGKELHSGLFPFDFKIDIKTKVLTSITANIDIESSIKNNSLALELRKSIFVENKPYTESIKIAEPDPAKPGEEVISELRGKFPAYIRLNDFDYVLENKNIAVLLYNLYKLNALNFNERPEAMLAFNNFYLGILKRETIGFEEFSKQIPIRIREFSESIPNSKKAIRIRFKQLSKIFEEDNNKIKVSGKNIDNSSIEKFTLGAELNNYKKQLEILHTSYEMKYELTN